MALTPCFGRVLVGDTIADRPAAGTREAQWPGTVFFPLDNTQAYFTDYSAPNVLAWFPYDPTGGGGGVTVAGSPEGIVVAGGPAYVVRQGYAGEANGDLSARIAGAWARLPIGPEGDFLRVVGGVPAWAPLGGAANYDLYLAGTTGNDANDGLTALTPVRTVARVMQLLPSTLTGYAVVHTAAEPITETALPTWAFPALKGPAARMVTFDAPLTQVLPSEACTGGTQGGGSVMGTVNSTSVLVPGAFRGLIFEWTSGLLSGRRHRIVNNSAGVIVIVGPFLLPPTPGDTFRVVQESATLTLPAPSPGLQAWITGSGVCFSGIDFRHNGNTVRLSEGASLLLNCASLRSTAGILRVERGASLLRVTASSSQQFSTPAIGFSPDVGPECLSSVQGYDRTGLELQGARFDAAALVANSNTTLLALYCYFTGAGAGIEIGGSRAELFGVFGDTVNNSRFLYVFDNSTTYCSAFNCSNNGGGSAIRVDYLSRFYGELLEGTGNLTFGLECYRHSRATVPDASAPSLIDGAAGAVQVGGNAAPSTWAQIFAGAPTKVNDLGAALPQLATVSTSI